MLKIIIATGIYPPDIGGPAQYAKNLFEEFKRRGYEVKVLHYKIEKKLPTGIRHFVYFLRLIFNLSGRNLIISLDTFSTGLPSAIIAKIFGKKIILRIGGDFLWESYIERTGELTTLPFFYEAKVGLSIKEKLIYFLTKFVLKNCSALVFSTEWQKEIFKKAYGISPKKCYIVENFYGEKIANFEPKEKNFIWAGRPLRLKNLEMLKIAFDEAMERNQDIRIEMITGLPYHQFIEKLKNCYAAILPSLSEVSPNFILDAIRVNKPFILTKETGFYEKLKDIGIFTNPLDKEEIKNKILFLAEENNYREYKKRVESFNIKHSWQDIANEILNIWAEN